MDRREPAAEAAAAAAEEEKRPEGDEKGEEREVRLEILERRPPASEGVVAADAGGETKGVERRPLEDELLGACVSAVLLLVSVADADSDADANAETDRVDNGGVPGKKSFRRARKPLMEVDTGIQNGSSGTDQFGVRELSLSGSLIMR